MSNPFSSNNNIKISIWTCPTRVQNVTLCLLSNIVSIMKVEYVIKKLNILFPIISIMQINKKLLKYVIPILNPFFQYKLFWLFLSISTMICYTIPSIVYSLNNETKICQQKVEYTFPYSSNNYANKESS